VIRRSAPEASAPLRCDVAVVGAGPAGSLAATFLARRGFDVVQVTGAPQQMRRPAEVLNPAARFLLREQGLPEPDDASAPCRGVLSVWDEAQPDFHDYGLLQTLEGRAVDRDALHASLAGAARKAGVMQIEGRVSRPPLQDGGGLEWEAPSGRSGRLRCQWTLIATGRRASERGRTRGDRLVALAAPWTRTGYPDTLVVEAAETGWWYAPPAVAGKAQLVFVTDAGLLPAGRQDRARWLDRTLQASRLVRCAGDAPDFDGLRGVDAHDGQAGEPITAGAALIGDAALSLDPLSGAGIYHAMSGALAAVDELAGTGAVGPAYRGWLERRRADQTAERAATYGRAARRFADAPFWRRRLPGPTGHASEHGFLSVL